MRHTAQSYNYMQLHGTSCLECKHPNQPGKWKYTRAIKYSCYFLLKTMSFSGSWRPVFWVRVMCWQSIQNKPISCQPNQGRAKPQKKKLTSDHLKRQMGPMLGLGPNLGNSSAQSEFSLGLYVQVPKLFQQVHSSYLKASTDILGPNMDHDSEHTCVDNPERHVSL